MTARLSLAAGLAVSAQAMGQLTLLNSAQLITTPTGACVPAGSVSSEVQLGNGLAGLSIASNATNNFRVADDMGVTSPGGWEFTDISFFGYQSNSGTATPTINGMNLRIWSGRPGDGGASIIFGDTTSNVLQSATFTGIYRYLNAACATSRPIWETRVGAPTRLGPGTYWLDWQATGTLAAGPFAVPITITGQRGPVGANARQFNGATGLWTDVIDNTVAQGFPFVVRGWVIGDMNCDQQINCQDIDLFTDAILGGSAACRFLNGDINGDGKVNFFDIDPFYVLLGTPAGGANCGSGQIIAAGTTTGTNLANRDEATTPATVSCAFNAASAWFRYTPTVSGTITIDTCGSSFDTVLYVYFACSPAPNQNVIACNDNATSGACSGSTQSLVSFGGNAGQTYYIRLAGRKPPNVTGNCNRGPFNLRITGGTPCYANCDASTVPPILNVNDFQCFLNRFAAGNPLANCDNSTTAPVLNVNDFQCFLNRYAAGCP